eukprot:2794445-Rhodomonas_salina.4
MTTLVCGLQLQRRCKKPATSRITIPGWGTCLLRMLDFGWADTSEGKSGNEIKVSNAVSESSAGSNWLCIQDCAENAEDHDSLLKLFSPISFA